MNLRYILFQMALFLGFVAFHAYIQSKIQVINYWMTIILFSLYIIQFVLFVELFVKTNDGNWQNLLKLEDVDSLNLQITSVKIKIDEEISLKGVIIKGKNVADSKKKQYPGVILHHGFTAKKEKMYEYAFPIALKGYIVLAVDARGHGESRSLYKSAKMDDWYLGDDEGIFPDFNKIVDFFAKNSLVDEERIACIGHSMGGTICLSYGITHPKIKIAIGISALYSFKDFVYNSSNKIPFSLPWLYKTALRVKMSFKKEMAVEEKFSPKFFFQKMDKEKVREKVRLVHTKNDHLVLFQYNFKKMQKDLQLPSHYILTPEKGDHELRGQETLITERILTWLENEL